jgi:hypothetical protein
MKESDGPAVTLVLSLDQINAILDALGRLPYVQVHQLIGTIQRQAQAQLAARSTPARNDTDPDDRP